MKKIVCFGEIMMRLNPEGCLRFIQDEYNWKQIFNGADWFHFTGITPAISESAAKACLDACKYANAAGISISCDLNYRKNLWSRQSARIVMTELMQYVDVCIANEEDAYDVFGISVKDTDVTTGQISHEGYIKVAQEIQERFGCEKIAITLRGSISANDNNWAAMLYEKGVAYFSKNYLIHIVDRVGGGDSFGGGLIYCLINEKDPQTTIEFATAASCLKQTIEYDFNHVSIAEVENLMLGNASGRVIRQ